MVYLSMPLIPLTQGFSTIVDEVDFPFYSQFNWHIARTHKGILYAIRQGRVNEDSSAVFLHRLIANAPRHYQVDHVNGDGLDNRRSNLRICSVAENRWNSRQTVHSSVYKGVCWQKDRQRWRAQITHLGKKIFIGKFKSEIEAAKAYDEVARRLCGEFAWLNFPD